MQPGGLPSTLSIQMDRKARGQPGGVETLHGERTPAAGGVINVTILIGL